MTAKIYFHCCFSHFALLTINVLFSWVWHQMSHRLSVDFDGSISPPPAIPRAFICLSLTTVCLTASLLIRTPRLPHSPAALTRKKNTPPHIPYPMTTTISGGIWNISPHPVFAMFWCATYVVWRHIRKHAALTDYSPLLLGLPQARSCPELESYMYKQFVIL